MAAVTIYDVAQNAGVSIKTVSRVLNAEPNVRPALRERVMAAVQSLGYRPNISARGLAGSRSFLIVAFVDAALTLQHWRSERGNNYLDRMQLGAMVRCRANGFHLLVELIDFTASQVEQEVSAVLGALRPDGVILTPPSSDDATVLDLLEAASTPYVRLSPEVDVERGARVFMDDVQASYELTRHLLELGHRRVGFIAGSPRYGASRARRAGYERAMHEAGIEIAPAWVTEGDFTFDSGVRCAQALLRGPDRPTAVFASNDDMALGVMHAAADTGLVVPRGLSVAGFDDTLSARFSLPPLTTVRQPVASMAGCAADMLIARSRANGAESPTSELVPFEFIVRESTAPPALV
jgi:LacI family transcriptional regulator